MNGFELCAKVKELYNEIPVIIITSHNEEDKLKKAFEAGAIDFLVTPFTKTMLQVRVLNVLNSASEKMKYKTSEIRALSELEERIIFLNAVLESTANGIVSCNKRHLRNYYVLKLKGFL